VVEYDVAGSLLVGGGGCNIFLRTVRPTGEEVIEQVIKRILMAYGRISGIEFPREETVVSTSRAEDYDDSLSPLYSLRSYFQVPLFVGNAFQGLVFVGAEKEQEFKEEHLRIFYTLAQQTGDSVQRLRALLAAERERMERVVRNLPAGVILLDDENHILLANPAANEILYRFGEKRT
jgi:PAS domain-containing protein